MAMLHMSKHHGLGNDFLVCADPLAPLDPALARAACARHTGVGADGLMWVGAGDPDSGTDLTMTLANADGSFAEISGNGIRCFVQAALRAGLVTGPTVRVATASGTRAAQVIDEDGSWARIRVDMGPVTVTGDATEWVHAGVQRAATAQVGNPHLVLLAPGGADVVTLGEQANAKIPGGVNVEVIGIGADGSVALEVYERGVGVTRACGTGATAAVAVAHHWGLVPAHTRVHMAGGDVAVDLDGGPDGSAHLTGPTVHVADIDFVWPVPS